jgi:2',3'-cyclic-nucleotide 2'-phosphodiesterase (5'-nucleotidase family)
MHRSSLTFRNFVAGCSVLFFAVALGAAPVRLVLLYTDDVHDHVRPGENGLGGLPYVAGYVHQVRAANPDALVLDAGDVTEKGDLVAFRSHGLITYEGMRRVGYDAVCVGNHDYDDVTLEHVRECEQALGQQLLCLNIVDAAGAPVFSSSRIVEKAGLRIGIIGMIVPREKDRGGLDRIESGRALAREAERLRPRTDLIIALCHEGTQGCAEWSRLAPAVQVFVGGHDHSTLEQPVIVSETGALIVRAGSYARRVGRLELEIDAAAHRVVGHENRIVMMNHAAVPVDADMLAWIRERERALAPRADEFVCDNPAELDYFSMGRLGAEALRRAAGAEVGFCHPYQIIRDALPAGRVDFNAVFKTGGMEGYHNVLVQMTGAQITAYVNALVSLQREPPEWAGFRITRHSAPGGGEMWTTDLAPERVYRVVMARREWDTRVLRLREKLDKSARDNALAAGKFEPAPTEVHFAEATVAYIRALLAEGDTLQGRIARLAQEREAPH